MTLAEKGCRAHSPYAVHAHERPHEMGGGTVTHPTRLTSKLTTQQSYTRGPEREKGTKTRKAAQPDVDIQSLQNSLRDKLVQGRALPQRAPVAAGSRVRWCWTARCSARRQTRPRWRCHEILVKKSTVILWASARPNFRRERCLPPAPAHSACGSARHWCSAVPFHRPFSFPNVSFSPFLHGELLASSHLHFIRIIRPPLSRTSFFLIRTCPSW